MQDGTLVFPIQTAHQNGIATTIMYSKDNGKTWEMPEIDNPVAPNQSSLENMVFELEPGKLVMTGRGNSRWAYSSTDMGKTWNYLLQLMDYYQLAHNQLKALLSM